MKNNTLLLSLILVVLILLFPIILYGQTALQVISRFNVPYGRFFMNNTQANGDINGDGTNDLIFACGQTQDTASCLANVFIYYTFPDSTSVPDQILSSPNLPYNYGFGNCISYSGDLNGDDVEDLVISSYYAGEFNSGYVHIYYGGNSIPQQPDVTLYGADYAVIDWFLLFGSRILSDCDLNGDGYDDLVIQGIGPIPEFYGNVFVFFGGEQLNTTCALNISGTIVNERLGTGLSTGDINGDGFDDLVITRHLPIDSTANFIYVLDVYSGGTNLSNVPVFEITFGSSATGGSNYPILANGDLNGDGYDDILIPYVENGSSLLKIIYGSSEFDSLSIQEYPITSSILMNPLFYCNFDNNPYADFCIWQHSYNSNGNFLGFKQTNQVLDLNADFVNTGELVTSNYGNGFLLGDINHDGYQDFFVFSGDNNIQNINYATILTENSVGTSDDTFPITKTEILCYPNPFSDRINIKHLSYRHDAKYEISIYDVKGRRVLNSSRMITDSFSWRPASEYARKLSSGIYLLKITENEKIIHTSKIIYTK